MTFSFITRTKKSTFNTFAKYYKDWETTDIHRDVNKCEVHSTEIKFLDLIVERDEVRINLEKVKAIVNWKVSTKLKNVQTFLDFVNFYRRFVKDFFKIIKSLIQLTKKNRLFIWSSSCEKTFQNLKKKIIEISIYHISRRN
jgi:hypothetical protein